MNSQMIFAGHPPIQLSFRPSATYQVLLTKCQFYAREIAKTSDTEKILDQIRNKILKSDSQCGFRIILVEKLRFVRPNWYILFEITLESKLT